MNQRWRRLLPWIGAVVAALVALAHIGLLARIFAGRVAYPYDLEWMEGGMLGHALRVLEGQPIYAEPSVHFISYLYTPLYPFTIGTLGRVFGVSYLLGRLVSIAGFVTACVVAAQVVRREAELRRDALPWAFVAVGLIASSFPHTGAWYDLVRNDSLYLGLVSSALYLLRYHHDRWWKVGLAGLLLGLGFLTKQTTSVFILFSGAAMLLLAWRRLLLLVPVVGAVAGGTVLLLDKVTKGWLWRYIFELHQGHDLYWERVWPQTEIKLLSLSPAVGAICGLWFVVTLVRWVVSRRLPVGGDRRRLYWFVLVIVGVAVSAIGFATQWAVENAYIPGFYFASIFAGVAGYDLSRRATLWRGPIVGGVVALVLGGALAAQLATQLYSPRPHLPRAGWRAAGDKLVGRLRRADGPVLMPYHPFYPYKAGKRPSYHQMGINDVTRAGLPFPKGIRSRINRRFYAALVFDTSPERRPDYGFVLRAYKFDRYLRNDESPGVVTGYRVSPRYLLVPKKSERVAAGERLVFGFEAGSYEGWSAMGRAFGPRPVGGPIANQGMAGPYEGRYLVSSYAWGGDRQTGSLTSPSFTIDKPILRYRVGGGRDPARLQVRVVVEGAGEIHRGTGTRSHIMERRSVDVRAHRGKTARVELVDRATGGWGHLLFDDVVLADR
ncbi:MAG: hypothetical protein CSA65_01440 [Proteobacteria bacterium]|nr:MAG: hypothetical protein CSB49_03110 [Pseudomonadota bacterium]PIE19675.1 MAG: hypothetical protein CSA65_01440 [Pseudomonadota bacterium]